MTSTPQTDVKKWYTAIEYYTALSVLLPLTSQEAKAVVHTVENVNTDAENALLHNLETRIHDSVLSFLPAGKCSLILRFIFVAAFVKLSCRSPKDVAASSSTMRDLYMAKIGEMSQPTDNDKVCCSWSSQADLR
jgi:hypothetical protein